MTAGSSEAEVVSDAEVSVEVLSEVLIDVPVEVSLPALTDVPVDVSLEVSDDSDAVTELSVDPLFEVACIDSVMEL